MAITKRNRANSYLNETSDLKEPIEDIDLDAFNGCQLWYIYLGLIRLDLIPELKEGINALVELIRDFGERYYDWAVD